MPLQRRPPRQSGRAAHVLYNLVTANLGLSPRMARARTADVESAFELGEQGLPKVLSAPSRRHFSSAGYRALYVWKNWACPAASWPTSSRLRTGTGDLPPTLRVVAGPQDPAVDQPGRRRHLGQDGRRIMLTGAVEDPGQKLRPVPWREAAPFLVQERAPLRPGQVPLNEGKHLAFLVRQVI